MRLLYRGQVYVQASRANLSRLRTLKDKLAKAAQEVYDAWDDARAEELNHGGICQDVAEAMAGVLSKNGFEPHTVSATIGEQHVYLVCKVDEGIFEVDIDPYTYERGGGYSWRKVPDVKLDAGDVVVNMLSPDPEDLSEYVEE